MFVDIRKPFLSDTQLIFLFCTIYNFNKITDCQYVLLFLNSHKWKFKTKQLIHMIELYDDINTLLYAKLFFIARSYIDFNYNSFS